MSVNADFFDSFFIPGVFVFGFQTEAPTASLLLRIRSAQPTFSNGSANEEFMEIPENLPTQVLCARHSRALRVKFTPPARFRNPFSKTGPGPQCVKDHASGAGPHQAPAANRAGPEIDAPEDRWLRVEGGAE
jgi:hypothetical protein